MRVLESVKGFLKDHSIENTSVLVAVSGGVDSTVLLDCLVKLKDGLSLDLTVAHLDHGLRGSSSREDAEFVRRRANELELESIVERRPVGEVTEGSQSSLEATAREVRYDFLSEAADRAGAEFVALGHNRNDQAETILMHLIRGTGLRGLAGMKEVKGPYIRPLVRCSREQILEYARQAGLDYREDETNQDTTYFRNKIRHQLIPDLETNYNRAIVDHLVGVGKLAREAQSYFRKKVKEITDEIKIGGEREGECFDRKKLLKYHPYLQKKTVREFIREARGCLKDVTMDHVEEVLEKIRKEPARTRLDLPGIEFEISRNRACFLREPEKVKQVRYRYEVEPESTLEIREANIIISLELHSDPETIPPEDFSSDSLTEVVDWSKVEQPLVVRNRREGDSFVPLGMDGTKKLKDFFIDSKVPFERRGRTPLVCDESGIIWVVGHRIDERYKLDRSTSKALLLKARRI